VGTLLPVFWSIALIGYFITLLTIYITPPTTHRCMLSALYGIMVGVVLYGIYIMTHPYSLAADVSPQAFEWILEASL
jgi:hypothetical protein